MFPLFKDYSFLELIDHEIHLNDFHIELEFKCTKLDGLVLYLHQFLDISGDYLSILLRNSHIELKYAYF